MWLPCLLTPAEVCLQWPVSHGAPAAAAAAALGGARWVGWRTTGLKSCHALKSSFHLINWQPCGVQKFWWTNAIKTWLIIFFVLSTWLLIPITCDLQKYYFISGENFKICLTWLSSLHIVCVHTQFSDQIVINSYIYEQLTCAAGMIYFSLNCASVHLMVSSVFTTTFQLGENTEPTVLEWQLTALFSCKLFFAKP